LQAKRVLLKKGYKPQSGVRTLRRELQDEIEDQIAEGVIAGLSPEVTHFDVAAIKGKVIVSPVVKAVSKSRASQSTTK
jgi:ATP-dependent Clp protease ATP-binding subunit ClpA